jgi:EF hand
MRLGVPLMGLVIVTVAAGLTGAPGRAQELRSGCDADRNGTVTAAEAQGRAEQRFELARGGADRPGDEQFAPALPDAGRLRQQFAQVDRDGDGRVSRDEWMAWFGPAYAGAANAAEAQLNGTD